MALNPSPPILFVDDDASCRRAYRKAANLAGFRVLDCATPDEAMEIARQQRPAVAVVDIQLKDRMNGFDLCRKLQADSPDLSVFLLTGEFCSDEHRLEAYQAGAAAYYQKPFSPIELANEIRFFLSEPKPLPGGKARTPGEDSVEVLLIDDDQDHLEAMALNFGSEGMTAYGARTGGRGLLLAHKIKPRAIVLDMRLPDLHGREMLDLLKAHPKSKHIPVWVWTGLKMSGHETSCLEGGAVDYLIKGAHDMSSLPLRVRQRLMPAPAAPELLARGPLSIGKTKKEVWIKGIAIEGLTDLEFHLLLLLVKRSTQIVSWAEVEQELRPYAAAPAVASRQTNALHVHLSHLKHKLGPLGESCLVTHKGLGLQFDESRL